MFLQSEEQKYFQKSPLFQPFILQSSMGNALEFILASDSHM